MNKTPNNTIVLPERRPDIDTTQNLTKTMRKPKQHSNARTSQYLRDRGFTVVPLQVWNAAAQIRQDALGLWDTLAYHPNHGVMVAQNTTKTHLADHRRVIEVAKEAIKWLQSGAKAFLISWRKVGAKSKGARLLWEPRIEQIVLAREKLFFVHVAELPTIGQPDPSVPTAAQEKRNLARSKRKQKAMQARVQAVLKAAGVSQEKQASQEVQQLPKLGPVCPSVPTAAKEKRRRTMAEREHEAMKAQAQAILVKMLAEQGDQKAA